mmetsp:Transcript_54198/g.87570  ORF Transcript_54198/g.87570 Transcript_54198/m.87570 type:complete len:407 (+) Transcript_54198:52-1272(+)
MPVAMASASLAKGPAQRQLEQLDAVFGPGYFEHGRLVFTVARDVAGVMKVAHRIQGKVNETLGAMVEVIMEHVKHEYWLKLHESSAQVGLQKGQEVPECQVTNIPDGVRVHPYRRDHLPTLEVMLLWEDEAGATQGRCLYTMPHPQIPSMEQVDDIFAQIEPYFAKRWLVVQLLLSAPVRGEFEEVDSQAQSIGEDEGHVGAGVGVTLLACHPYGFASEQSTDGNAVAHVSQCQPMAFKAVTDQAGQAKICFLPAGGNKVQVSETERFHGAEVALPGADIRPIDQGVTSITLRLVPKALATVTVHVFEMPRKLPASDETDGIIDWAAEERVALPTATVELNPLKDQAAPMPLSYLGDDTFVVEDGGLAEGCVNLVVSCPGYESEERVMMLLVGPNEFYIPMQSRAR